MWGGVWGKVWDRGVRVWDIGAPLGVGVSETLYQGDDALSTKPVMHYQGTADLCY